MAKQNDERDLAVKANAKAELDALIASRKASREPETDEPEDDEPLTGEPVDDEPETDEPEDDEPETDEPEDDEPETDEPEDDESDEKEAIELPQRKPSKK